MALSSTAFALSKAYILAGLFSCDPAPSPLVNIYLDATPPALSHTLDTGKLGQLDIATSYARRTREIAEIGGVTESVYSSNFTMDFQATTNKLSGKNCAVVKGVDIHISYAPVIHIAQEFAQGSCQYNAIWLHEQKHVAADTAVIQDAMPMIKLAVEQTVMSLGVQEPKDPEGLAVAQTEAGDRITAALQPLMALLEKARLQKQETIDTPQEYASLAAQCPRMLATPQ